MLDAMTRFYETSYANVHRGVYVLAERATAALEGAREKVRALRRTRPTRARSSSSATRPRRSTSSRTRGGSSNLGPGDLVVVTELEHHSNFVPWQYIAGRTGAELPDDPARRPGRARPLHARRDRAARATSRSSPTNLVSNSLGTINPVEKLAAWAHEQGAILVSTQRRRRRTRRSTCRRSAATSSRSRRTRCAGRASVGALWGRAELLEAMEPFHLGGHMIRSVALEETTWGELPHKFEAGTRADRRGGRLRRGDRLPQRGRARGDRGARARARRVRARAARRTSRASRSTARRPSGARASSRSTSTASTRTTSRRCSTCEGVAIRAGHHCCQPLMQKLGVAATNRASFYLYTLPRGDRPARRRPAQVAQGVRWA